MIKRRDSTPCHTLVKLILYTSNIDKVAAVKYEKVNEPIAIIKKFEEQLTKMATESDACKISEKHVLEKEEALLCEICYYWYHKKCISMGNSAYKHLMKTKRPWFCAECNINNLKNDKDKAGNLKSTKTGNITNEDLLEKLNEMQRENSEIKLSMSFISDKLDEQMAEMQKLKIENEIHRQEITDLQHQVSELEAETRGRNIVINGLTKTSIQKHGLNNTIKKY